MEMSRFKLAFAVVLVCLCVSVSFNVVQYLGTEHSPKTFVFTWVWDEKEYRMDLAFDTVPTLSGANLSITAKINRDQYQYGDSLDILFDLDGDGEFKSGNPVFVLHVDNTVNYGIFSGEWRISMPRTPVTSPYHTCTFDDSGYTFKINFPLEELNLKNDLIYAVFSSFWTSFHFDPEGELFK